MPRREGPLPVGAVYYSWFPERWQAGTFGDFLEPPVQPVLGEYPSGPLALSVHAAVAGDALDVLVFDLWPRATGDDLALRIWERVRSYYRDPVALGATRTALLYELQALVRPTGAGRFVLDAAREAELVADLSAVADFAFGHPSYLRIDGRPVVFLYLTRLFEGDLAGSIERLRAALLERGHDVHLVGDEVYWQVVAEDGDLLPPGVPNRIRLRAFDSLFGYAPVLTVERFCGAEGVRRFLDETASLARRYASIAAQEGKAYMPTVLPGFNDRGVRPSLAHCTVPRGVEGARFLERAWEAWVAPFADSAPLVFATSFNEWNEGTQLEPARGGPSSDPFYTEGLEVSGGGSIYLDTLAMLADAS